MAGYNRGIVATRKLNEKNKARLKASGDTEFGFIKGRLSHINKDEKRQLTAADAYDISLRERVESDIAEKGAGTINPYTGMPEYHGKIGIGKDKHPRHHTLLELAGQVGDALNPVAGITNLYEDITGKESGYDTLSDFIEDPGGTNIGQVWTENITDPLSEGARAEEAAKEKAGMWGEQKTYTELQAMSPEEREEYLQTFGLEGSDSQFITPFETEPFDFIREGAGLEREQLGTTLGAGYQEAGVASQQAITQSGFARKGSIAADYGRQMKGLTQDYKAGMKSTALGERRDLYGEQARQLERFYGDISTIKQFT